MAIPNLWSDITSSKAVILGLDRYAFRREYSAARLAAAGFSRIEYVSAFDGFHADVDQAFRDFGVNFNKDLGRGHKGCAFTHMREWERMVQEEAPFRIFFEDDTIGHLELSKSLGQKFWDATPKDFDILYMGNMMAPNDPALADPEALVVRVPTYCLHAYMLSLNGAKKLLRMLRESNAPVMTIDIELINWQLKKAINWYCWNGTWTQKSFPTFDEGLPWQAFQDVITPQKDTGLFWQNMRVGSTLAHPELQITIPQYSL
jgi:GR25 family glycosyltransferase involved in LPS biosynthesis